MNATLTSICLMGIISFLFGCNPAKIQKETLYGNWEAITLNGETIDKHGFISIKMNITPDSIYIITEMKTFGEVTTKSEGTWQLNSNMFKSKIGENSKESHLQVRGTNITFSPDPLFKQKQFLNLSIKGYHKSSGNSDFM